VQRGEKGEQVDSKKACKKAAVKNVKEESSHKNMPGL